MKIIITFPIVFILVLSGVLALVCDYDSEPFLDKKIEWYCELSLNESFECVSYVEIGGGLVAVYPNEKIIEDVGRVNYFTSRNKMVNVWFSNKDIFPLNNYTFGVKCSSLDSYNSEIFNASVFPVFKEQFESAYRFVWIKENVGYLIATFILIIVGVVIGIYLWRLSK